ncbi:MAG TPA: glycosyltransferase family protein [Thermoanaerobaculia bacterium]|nr:glycosyltransferase family protein [Thermoanaerobaculia bacterium]
MTPVLVILQARMASTRLPGKVLATIGNVPMLLAIARRVAPPAGAAAFVVATSTDQADDPIVRVCERESVTVLRGSQDDCLDRFEMVARAFPAETIVRITGDNPLVDWPLIEKVLAAKEAQGAGYASTNLPPATFPTGLSVEAFSRTALSEAWTHGIRPYEREHITPYIIDAPDKYPQARVADVRDRYHLRVTVDTPEDLTVVRHLFHAAADILAPWEELIGILEAHPEWAALNSHVVQRRVHDSA